MRAARLMVVERGVRVWGSARRGPWSGRELLLEALARGRRSVSSLTLLRVAGRSRTSPALARQAFSGARAICSGRRFLPASRAGPASPSAQCTPTSYRSRADWAEGEHTSGRNGLGRRRAPSGVAVLGLACSSRSREPGSVNRPVSVGRRLRSFGAWPAVGHAR